MQINFAKKLFKLVKSGEITLEQYTCYIIGQCFQINLNVPKLVPGSPEYKAVEKFSIGCIIQMPWGIENEHEISP